MKPPVRIRRAAAQDVPALTALTAELGYPADAATIADRLAGLAASEHDLLAVAESDGRVIGWLHASDRVTLESGRRVEIVGLIVAREARRAGAGRALVDQAEIWAHERGARHVVVRSNLQRTESRAFYPALGFVAVKNQAVYRKAL